MIRYLERMLKTFRPAFNRQATFIWFVVIFAGFLIRSDTYGVSSIIRALYLAPACYPNLLHFFHSSAFNTDALLEYWWKWLMKSKICCMVNNRIVLVGDHTKTVKDGRKIPNVNTLHQDSEIGSKPTFFRGHHWGCLSLLTETAKKRFSMPLWAEIHNCLTESRAVRLVSQAIRIAQFMAKKAYLVLDAFFAVGPVFQAAKLAEQTLYILTRAKKNVVAYTKPVKKRKVKRGRPRLYGDKIKLMPLFNTRAHKFKTMETKIYNKVEIVKYYTINLLWRPIKETLRFILIESSRGRIILMTSDLELDVRNGVQLYCSRSTIETLFNILKNLLGGMKYHFWSKYLKPSSRRPTKNQMSEPVSTNMEKTQNTLVAIEKFVLIQIMVVGTLQLLSFKYPKEIRKKAKCWLRTPCGEIPSPFVTRMAMTNTILNNLFTFAKDWITQLILAKQDKNEYITVLEKVA